LNLVIEEETRLNEVDMTLRRKPLLDRLAGKVGDRPAIWLMRQAGRYLPEYREIRSQTRSFLELCYTPDLATEVTLQPVRRFGMDGAILFSDILVVPDALGWPVRFVEGEGPRLERFSSQRDLSRLDATRLRGHLAPVYETVRRLEATLPGNVALIGFSGAPWTLAAYMVEGGGAREFHAARLLARQEPGLFADLIEQLTDAVVDHLAAQAEAGAEALQIFDSWAGVLPPQELKRWCLDPCSRIVARLKKLCPDVPVILFPRGAGASYVAYARESGASGLGLDTSVPMEWAASMVDRLGGLCLQGNLDPVALLGPPEAMLAEASAIVEAAARRPLIFNLGHGVLPQTSPEAVARLVSHLKSSRS
jgi:uroporphyrinogen decarboxylase